MSRLLVSDRNIPLVCQAVRSCPQLTVENYMKWYSMFLIQPDGSVTKVEGDAFDELEEIATRMETHWMGDHIFNPAVVLVWAKQKGVDVHSESLEMMIGRWVLESGRSARSLVPVLQDVMDLEA